MNPLTDPFFWALLSLLGLHGAGLVVSGHRLGRNAAYVTGVLLLVTVGRVVLVLPFCAQPRFHAGTWSIAIGTLVLVAALAVGAPALGVRWWSPPAAGMRLRTRGVYALVRHPIYLCEVLWPVGWSLIFGSIVGLALTPLWWSGFLLHALLEEDEMRRAVGDEYRLYEARVRGRILRGLPI